MIGRSVLENKHIISATGSAAKPRNPPKWFPSSGQSVGNLRDSTMSKEPEGSILIIFDPQISLYLYIKGYLKILKHVLKLKLNAGFFPYVVNLEPIAGI